MDPWKQDEKKDTAIWSLPKCTHSLSHAIKRHRQHIIHSSGKFGTVWWKNAQYYSFFKFKKREKKSTAVAKLLFCNVLMNFDILRAPDVKMYDFHCEIKIIVIS